MKSSVLAKNTIRNLLGCLPILPLLNGDQANGGEAPTIQTLSPSSALASSTASDFTLTISGFGFAANCQVLWNGTVLQGPVIQSGESNIMVMVPGDKLDSSANIETATVTVKNPPDESNPLAFTIYSSSVDPQFFQTVVVPPGGIWTVQTAYNQSSSGVVATFEG